MKNNATNKMKKQMGKITVKHFININLRDSKAKNTFFDEKGTYHDMTPPFHPLYVKITFQRATTQLKSIIGLDFASVEEAEFKCGWIMDAERKMISDVIANEYQSLGDKFNLKGLNEKCKPFSQSLLEFFSNTFLVNDYNKMIKNTGSPYMQMLIWNSNNIPGSTYYNASEKLLGEIPQLLELKEKFMTYRLFEKAITNNDIAQIQMVQWLYGDAKEQFSQEALKSGLTFKQVVSIVTAIDEEVARII